MDEKKQTKVNAKDVFKFTLHYWKTQKFTWSFSVIFLILAVATDSIKPLVFGKIFDQITGAGTYEDALFYFTALIILFAIHASLWTLSNILWNISATKMLKNIVDDLLYKVQRFSTDWHANSFAGATVQKITRTMWSFDKFEDTLYLGMLPSFTILVAITVMLLINIPLLGIYAFVSSLVFIILSIYCSVYVLAPKFSQSAQKDTKLGASIADIITSIATVKSFAKENDEDTRFRKTSEEWREFTIKAWLAHVYVDFLRSIVRYAIISGLLGIGLWLWHEGKASAGDVVTALTSGLFLAGYLREIGNHFAHLQLSASEMEEGIEYWKREDEVKDASDATEFIPSNGSIEFKNVTFSYEEQAEPIYEDFSLQIRPGENISLVGVSGSGKSTFVKLLQRLYDIDSGEILIDGQNIAKVTQKSLRKYIGLVPQDPILFHRSLAENISYGKEDASIEEIISASKKAHCHEFISKLPQGYKTLVGERGVKLSGGERQRVAIARAILADAPILVLDEATSSLDSLSEKYIQDALEKLVKNKTTITIAHRLATIRNVDRILVFENGKIIEQGTHKNLIADKNSLYKKLYDMQSLGLVGDL